MKNRKLEFQIGIIALVFGLSVLITTMFCHPRSYIAVGIGVVAILIGAGFKQDSEEPDCKWCGGRHRGRCIYNPRSGRFFANARDGHFDLNNPNV